MSIFARLTWKTLWKNKVRTLVTIAGVILSAAMFAAVTTMTVSLLHYMIDLEVYEGGSYFLACNQADEALGARLRAEEEVELLGDYQTFGYTTLGEYGRTYLLAAVDSPFYELTAVRPSEGRLPENGSELLLSEHAAQLLAGMGLPHCVGDSLTLEVGTEHPDDASQADAQSMTFTIVGLVEQELYLENAEPALLTAADGTQEALWHCYYLTTARAETAVTLAERLGETYSTSLHHSLLTYYGQSRYSNLNDVLRNFALILCLIILIGSVSLIYNAFSISVSERTRQFGLLASVGATRRQLRYAVLFEAAGLCLLGIPLGLLCGWGGIAVTLHFLGDRFSTLLFQARQSGLVLRAVVSLPVLLVAAATGVLTVFLSAWLPARRATRVTPLSAIRQNADYRVRSRQVRVSRLAWRVWGLPGVLAKKYYSVSRRKYRTTVISLAVSILLFISTFSFASVLRSSVADASNLENYDFLISRLSDEQMQSIRSRSDVAESAVISWSMEPYSAIVTQDMMTAEYASWAKWPVREGTETDMLSGQEIGIYYLEDAVLEEWLIEQGMDPAPFLNTDVPCALVCSKAFEEYTRDADTGELTRYTRRFDTLREEITSLRVVYSGIPEEIAALVGDAECEVDLLAEGERIFLRLIPYDEAYTLPEAYWFELVQEDGQLSYYAYDREAQTRADTASCKIDATGLLTVLRIGAQTETLPFGISASAQNEMLAFCVILPLSMQQNSSVYNTALAVNTCDYASLSTWLKGSNLPYSDEAESEMQARNLILVVNVFSYGFIALISLICICNIFNTISTNIALRRRDFGMLRSVGLKTRELYRMMGFECLRYGATALLAGLPLALLCSYGIEHSAAGVMQRHWQPPWLAIAVAAGCVFLVVFSTMLYAVSRLRRDNPIEAIRMENL